MVGQASSFELTPAGLAADEQESFKALGGWRIVSHTALDVRGRYARLGPVRVEEVLRFGEPLGGRQAT